MNKSHRILIAAMLLACLSGALFADRMGPKPSSENIFYDLPTLETERLVLRSFTLDDVDAMYEFMSDSDVVRFLPWGSYTSKDQAVRRIEGYLKNASCGEAHPWAIECKEDGNVIGLCGMYEWKPAYLVAYPVLILSKKYWGKGLATEAVRAAFACVFDRLGVNRIQSSVHPDNKVSLRVHEKLGFSFIGIIPECFYYEGGFRDRVLYNCLRCDFCSSVE